jgi:hypothetical protein
VCGFVGEFSTGLTQLLNYLCVWVCPAQAMIFNPNVGKLDFKTVSCHFIGYSNKS